MIETALAAASQASDDDADCAEWVEELRALKRGEGHLNMARFAQRPSKSLMAPSAVAEAWAELEEQESLRTYGFRHGIGLICWLAISL